MKTVLKCDSVDVEGCIKQIVIKLNNFFLQNLRSENSNGKWQMPIICQRKTTFLTSNDKEELAIQTLSTKIIGNNPLEFK